MIRPIVLWGSEVLEQQSEPITNITDAEVKLVHDMIETMYKAPGVGLAAPQVGVPKRILVTDTTSGEKKDHLFTILNPEIVVADGEQFEEEGCLSIPNFTGRVRRPYRVIISGKDPQGREKIIEGEALLSRVFAHEVDHLNGVLFIDHLGAIKRDIIKRKIRKKVRAGEW